MDRPRLQVGDVFRHYGDAYRQQHAGSLSRDQLRVMTAIQRCRTAALGGHVEQCDQCHFQRIAYNRVENVLMPGLLRVRLGSRAFGVSGSFVRCGLASTFPILPDLAPRSEPPYAESAR